MRPALDECASGSDLLSSMMGIWRSDRKQGKGVLGG